MLYTKACPRCSGDIKLDKDNYGVYARCLQCGFNRDFQTRKAAPVTPDALPGQPAMPIPAVGTELPAEGARREAA